MTQTTVQIPGYLAGSWTIDPTHSDVSFLVRHMMVSKVRGHFPDVAGTIVTAENPLDSTVNATVKLTSIDTRSEQRDNHIRSADFFDVEKHPEMTFASTGLAQDGDDFVLTGDLTLKDVTKSVPLTLEIGGFGPDAYGGTRAGFTASGSINRSDFGVDIQMPLDGGGVVVGEKITINLEIEAVLDQPKPGQN
ncbi:MAG: YceI family protein [Jatrophihabitans sp.]